MRVYLLTLMSSPDFIGIGCRAEGLLVLIFLPTLGGNPTSNRFETATCLPDEALTKVGHTCGRWAAF
jgi:hypothetical protein